MLLCKFSLVGQKCDLWEEILLCKRTKWGKTKLLAFFYDELLKFQPN